MKQPTTVRDDILRTVIFVFGLAMGGYFLFAHSGFWSIVLALPFLMVGGANIRAAWGPYGHIIEAVVWLFLSVGALIFVGIMALIAGGNHFLVPGFLVGFMVAYSVFAFRRSLRRLREWEEQRAEEQDRIQQ